MIGKLEKHQSDQSIIAAMAQKPAYAVHFEYLEFVKLYKYSVPLFYSVPNGAASLNENTILEIYCPKCQRFSGLRYEHIFDIPDEAICIHCDDRIERAAEHAIVVYKVL